MKTTRRNLLLGGLAAGAVSSAFLLKPKDRGADHTPYFRQLSKALDDDGISTPSLVIDQQKLRSNIATLKRHIGKRFDYRIVAKSLPSIPLLRLIMEEADTNRLMLFHQPFLSQVAEEIPGADVLMGKPMPVAAARTFYDRLANNNNSDNSASDNKGFDPARQLQWLVDSSARLQQYQSLAEQLGTTLRINIELDVGLHRGGVQNDPEFVEMLHLIESSEQLSLAGLMGYEPHVAKVPGDKIGHRNNAMAQYQHYITLAEQTLGRSIQDLTLNAGGSPTYQFYDEGNFPHNELAAGSCLVKPTDFDLPSLADHTAASWIATPVIKALDKTEIPGVDGLGSLMSAWNPNRRQTFFTYGGYWKAKPESPSGLSTNPVYGRSTNQEMYNGSASINLNQDDWIFLRPTQSEFVFLQFGDLIIVEGEKVIGRWPILKNT